MLCCFASGAEFTLVIKTEDTFSESNVHEAVTVCNACSSAVVHT